MPSPVISCMRYRDCDAAIEWLRDVLGFQEQAVFRDDTGNVMHAQLVIGDGMIMLGPLSDTPYGKLMKQPNEIGGFNTQSVCLIVQDPDATYAIANKHGAKIVIDIKDEAYGGRSFTCQDPEGHFWSIGSFDPWAPAS